MPCRTSPFFGFANVSRTRLARTARGGIRGRRLQRSSYRSVSCWELSRATPATAPTALRFCSQAIRSIVWRKRKSVRHSTDWSAQIFEDFPSGVCARGASNPVARMGARAAQIQPLERCPITSPPELRTHGENLIKRKLAVERMTAGESVGCVEVFRRQYLPRKNFSRKIRGVSSHGFYDRVGKRFALLIPIPLLEAVRGELHVDGHHMLSGRRKRIIQNRRDRNIQIGRPGKIAVLGIVERALQVIDSGPDVNSAGERRTSVGRIPERCECGKCVEREVQLCRGAA